MNNKDILENAPEDVTHYLGGFKYFNENEKPLRGYNPPFEPKEIIAASRSLADIRCVIELEAENERLHEAIEILRTAGNLCVYYALNYQYASVIEWNEMRDKALKLRDGKQ